MINKEKNRGYFACLRRVASFKRKKNMFWINNDHQIFNHVISVMYFPLPAFPDVIQAACMRKARLARGSLKKKPKNHSLKKNSREETKRNGLDILMAISKIDATVCWSIPFLIKMSFAECKLKSARSYTNCTDGKVVKNANEARFAQKYEKRS